MVLKEINCPNCGSTDIVETTDGAQCAHCGSKFKTDKKPVAKPAHTNPRTERVASREEQLDRRLIELMQQKGMLDAVKFYKDATGYNLLESKNYVDQLAARHNVKANRKGCFVATACYGDYDAPEVLALRRFRDDVLMQSLPGKVFVSVYYAISPGMAFAIQRSQVTQRIIRTYLLQPIVNLLQR